MRLYRVAAFLTLSALLATSILHCLIWFGVLNAWILLTRKILFVLALLSVFALLVRKVNANGLRKLYDNPMRSTALAAVSAVWFGYSVVFAVSQWLPVLRGPLFEWYRRTIPPGRIYFLWSSWSELFIFAMALSDCYL